VRGPIHEHYWIGLICRSCDQTRACAIYFCLPKSFLQSLQCGLRIRRLNRQNINPVGDRHGWEACRKLAEDEVLNDTTTLCSSVENLLFHQRQERNLNQSGSYVEPAEGLNDKGCGSGAYRCCLQNPSSRLGNRLTWLDDGNSYAPNVALVFQLILVWTRFNSLPKCLWWLQVDDGHLHHLDTRAWYCNCNLSFWQCDKSRSKPYKTEAPCYATDVNASSRLYALCALQLMQSWGM
jgi:hypothetical protein